MTISAEKVRFDNDQMRVALSDGQELAVPLTWFPRLLAASPAQRADYEISVSGLGLHWDALDEDISVPGLLCGQADRTTWIPAAV